MRFRANVGHPPFIIVKRANPVTMVGQAVGLTLGTGGTVYTPTHYVAPFASVSGASNDYTDLGAAAYAAATSTGTPTTLGTAMARAVAPNKVRVAPGTYSAPHTSDRWVASFSAAASNSTASDPLVFFAQYPAASNYGSTSLYSTVAKIGSASGTNNPVLGPGESRNYIIFDGFYCDETNALSAPNGGVFQLHATTGSEYRRCVVDRGSGTITYAVGYNANAFYAESTINCKVRDCRINGYVLRTGGVITQPNLEMYNSTGFVAEYCTLDNFGIGMFQKESDTGWSSTGTFRYNLFKNGGSCLWVQQGASYSCHHNLCYNVSTGFEVDGGPVVGRPALDLDVYQNTFVLRSSSTFPSGYGGGGVIIADGAQLVTSQFRDNIVYSKTGMTVNTFRVRDGGSSSWTWPSWTSINNNCYYREDAATLTFTGLAFNAISGITNWRAETGHEANTITSDPQFVSVVGENFRLANNGQAALTGSSTGGRIGCYETGSEEIGVRANPTY